MGRKCAPEVRREASSGAGPEHRFPKAALRGEGLIYSFTAASGALDVDRLVGIEWEYGEGAEKRRMLRIGWGKCWGRVTDLAAPYLI